MSELRLFFVLTILSTLISGCGSSAQNAPAKPTKAIPHILFANNYTGSGWTNGVRQKDGRSNMFYYLAKSGEAMPDVGDTLVFAKSGKVKVIKVDRKEETSKTSIFVTVDKDLDPAGDGFPNKIMVEK